VGVLNTNSVFTTSYSDWTATSPYQHTTGLLALDAVSFTIPQGLNAWLTDIKVGNTGGALNVSRTALTAITLVESPEPSTWMLAFGCLGVIGYSIRRRRSA